ncbi:MAG: aquaporin [bacterium]
MTQRNKLGIIVSEFLGTAILTSTILAQANSNVIVNKTWFVAATAGITLTMLCLVIGKVSGAHVNPAVTVGLWTLRKIETTTAVVYISSQLLGAAVALRLFQYFQNDLLLNIAGGFEWRIFVAEAIGTMIFTMGVASVVTQKLEGYKAAFVIGSSLMLGIVVASTASNGILNPAVALGLNSWNWTYAVAPILGSVLGMNIYDLFIASESSLKVITKPLDIVSNTATKKVATKKKTSKKAKN